MKIKKAFRFKLKLHEQQAEQLRAYAGQCRFLWNKFLAINLSRLSNKQPIMRYHEMDFWSKLYKKSEEFGFLKESPAHILQQKLKDLDRAFMDCFDKNQPNKRLPRYRKKGLHDSFRFPEPKHFLVEGNRVKLPKLGWIKFFRSQKIAGDIKNATISCHSGKWTISFQVECEIVQEKKTSSIIGLDMGIAFFAMPSQGKGTRSKRSYRKYERTLAVAQKALSRKQKFSSNWVKAKNKVTKIHRKIANVRKDFLHWNSTKLSKSHAIICVEDLKVSNMSKSAKGTIESPGKQVKAKSGLNKSILDQGWSTFCNMLEYKLAWRGGSLIKVDPKYTSQRCVVCDHTSKANRQEQKRFQCVQCGHTENADRHAARNILAAGHAVLACGASAVAQR